MTLLARSIRGLWWIYLVLNALMLLFAILDSGGGMDAIEALSTIAGGIGLLAVYGHVRRRRVFTRVYWAWAAPSAIALLSASMAIAFWRLSQDHDATPMDWALFGALFVLFVLPSLYALFVYVFRSPSIWRADVTNA